MGGRVSITKVVAEDPQGTRHEKRLPAPDYLQIVAATNFKQRIRKNLEYYHADRLNYACTGTPNRLEYDQGFFVKNGDGCGRRQADRAPLQDPGLRHGAPPRPAGGGHHHHADDRHLQPAPRARTSSTSSCPTRRWTSRSGT